MKTICIYHSRDLDGWMSAAIVMKWFLEQEKIKNPNNEKLAKESPHDYIKQDNIWFLGWDHGDEIPDLSSYYKIIMADIAFPVEEMIKLRANSNHSFVWIDHHKSAIIDSVKENYQGLSGTRNDKFAACELTWEYFFSNDKMPEIVRLLGRYDCFGHKGTDEHQKVLEFQYASRAYINNYEEAYNYLCEWISTPALYLQSWLVTGKDIYKYLCTEAKQTYKRAFPITFPAYDSKGMIHDYKEATSKFLCVNQERFNPINFGIDYHKEGYDGFACFWYKNKKWHWSLYNDNGKVDCSVIAKQLDGGGHKGAAGMVVDDLSKIF